MNRIPRSLAPVLAGAMGLLLVGAVAITASEPAQATHITKKAVYRDATRGTSWVGQDAAQAVTDFLSAEGYEVLTGATIRAWLDARIADREPSVLINSHDVLPDEALRDNATPSSTGAPFSSNPIRRYLLSGGRMVAFGDIPFYVHAYADGTSNSGWGDTGAQKIIGFNTSSATRDVSAAPEITPEGAQWGLTTTDIKSQRPAVAGFVDVILAKDKNGSAAAWAKYYTTFPGRGEFIRLWDTGLSAATVTAELLANLKAIAEYEPAGAVAAPLASGIEGSIVDKDGKPYYGWTVEITQVNGPKILAVTDENGRFFAMLAPGDYAIKVPDASGLLFSGIPAGNVTVAADAMTTLPDFVNSTPIVDLIDENGYQWKLLLGPEVAPEDDYSAINADEAEFVDFDITATAGNWTTYLDGAGIANGNYDGWLRLRFPLPAEWKTNPEFRGQSLRLYGFNFNAADETWFNGQLIGLTGRMKDDPSGTLRVDGNRDYNIPAALVNWDGDNVLAIHGWHDGGTGGFTSSRPKLMVNVGPPRVSLTKENGFNWKILLGPNVDPMADFSAVNADESTFDAWNVTNAVGNWTTYLDAKGIANGNMSGWLRTRFTLPADFLKWQGRLEYTGMFNGASEVYFNGVSIGKTGLLASDPGGPTRDTSMHTYSIPENLVNWTGENVIAVRGWHDGGSGAFTDVRPALVATGVHDPIDILPGDVNGDGKINVQDATLSLRIAVGILKPTVIQQAAGDVNNDGKLNIQDTTLILQVVTGNKPASDLK